MKSPAKTLLAILLLVSSGSLAAQEQENLENRAQILLNPVGSVIVESRGRVEGASNDPLAPLKPIRIPVIVL